MICKKDLKKGQHEAKELKMQFLYKEHYSRRENLMFLGIQENDAPIDTERETENNNVENTKEVIYNFLQKELSLENAVSRFEFQRIRRVGKRSGKKPRPNIARFLRYSDREEVLLCAKTSLKGKDYGVFEDMPKELYQLRKAEMKKLKTQNIMAAQPISAESIWTNYSLTVTTFLEIYFLLFFLLSSNIHVGNMEIFAV